MDLKISLIKEKMGNGIHFIALVVFQLLILRRASIVLGESYGIFAYCYASASIAVAFTLLGLHGTLMRLLAICSAKQAWKAASRILFRALALRVGLAGIAVFGLGLYLFKSSININSLGIAYVCLFFFLQATLLLQHSIFQGLGLYRWMALGSLCLFFGLFVHSETLADLFKMLSVGYGCSLVVGGIILLLYFSKKESQDIDIGEEINLKSITRFSFLLSLAALCMMIADNGPILLLKGHLSPEVFSVLALAFNLALYPSRINAFHEALILPEISEAWHVGGSGKVKEIFSRWMTTLHFIGPLIMIPIVLVIGPIIRLFFPPELEPAIFFTALLILANIARVISPVSMAVFIASGNPGKFALCNAFKMVLDLVIVFCLREFSFEVMLVALIMSWVLYVNLLHALAYIQFSLPWKLDWFMIIFMVIIVGILFTEWANALLTMIWCGMALYAFVRGKEWLSSCQLK